VEVRSQESATWDLLAESLTPIGNGALVCWNTLPLSEGDYELRLSVTDTLGLTGINLLSVVIDNEAPWADETAPAVVKGSTGGDIYTTEGQVHLYFPPHCFETEAVVVVEALVDGDVPDTLSSGARRLLTGYEIGWGEASLKKAVTLRLNIEDSVVNVGERPVLYLRGDDDIWTRLGGTVGDGGKEMSIPVSKAGWYALFGEQGEVSQGSGLSMGSITPRVFSPRGGSGDREAAIGFTLGRSGGVTVKVYNRAGYLVRTVIDGKGMGAGANLVRWDGRGEGGGVVPGGLYLVTVEALGTEKTKTLSVVGR
jgi:hypothetical protein